MYYGYNLNTTKGTLYPFTNEANAAKYPPVPRGQFYSFTNPTAQSVATKRAMIVYPTRIGLAPAGVDVDALAQYAGTFLGVTQEGIPVFLGPPVADNLMGQKSVIVMDLGAYPNCPEGVKRILAPVSAEYTPPGGGPAVMGFFTPALVAWIVLMVTIAVIASIWLAGKFFDFRTQEEYYRAQQHAADIIAESQKIVKEEYAQVCSTGACDHVNGGAGCDVHRVFYANGDVVSFAMTQCGANFLGGNSKVDKEGWDSEDLVAAMSAVKPPAGPLGDVGAWLIPAALIVGAGAIGYAAVKAIGARKERSPERKEASA
jgi:hypothetical protein